MSRRLTPRSCRKSKQTCLQPSPSKPDSCFILQPGPALAFDSSFDGAVPALSSDFKENFSSAACNSVCQASEPCFKCTPRELPRETSAAACVQLVNTDASETPAAATTDFTPATHTQPHSLPPSAPQHRASSQPEISSKSLLCPYSSQPLPNPLETAATSAGTSAACSSSRPRRTTAKQNDQHLADPHSQSSSQGEGGCALSQVTRQMSVVDAFAAMRQNAQSSVSGSGKCAMAAGRCVRGMQLLCVHSACDRRDCTALLHLHGVAPDRKNVTVVVKGFLPCIYVRPARNSPHFVSVAAAAAAAAVAAAAAGEGGGGGGGSSLPSLDTLVSSLNHRLRPKSLSPSSSSKDWRIARGILRAGTCHASHSFLPNFLE